MARASDARLYFIEHQQDALLVTQFPHLTQVVKGGDANAAFALDGLQNHAGRGVGDCCTQRGDVAPLHLIKAGIAGQETFDVQRVGAGCQRRHGAAVEGL